MTEKEMLNIDEAIKRSKRLENKGKKGRNKPGKKSINKNEEKLKEINREIADLKIEKRKKTEPREQQKIQDKINHLQKRYKDLAEKGREFESF